MRPFPSRSIPRRATRAAISPSLLTRWTSADPIKMVQALLIAFAVLVPLASAALVVLTPPSLWVDTLFDDAYYYLGVARHLALGQGSMFAPPLATNGYQPLWLALLSGVALLVGADRTWLAAGMHLTILFCVLAFLHLCGRREGAR